MQFARLLLATAALLVTAPAFAQANAQHTAAGCRLRIDSNGTNWIIQGYDPFSSNEAVATFDVLFFNDGDSACRFRPIFMTDGTVFGLQNDRGRRVGYTLVDTFGGYDATPLGGRTVTRITNRPVNVAPGAQQLVRYVMNVAASEIPGDGLFSQRLIMEADQVDGTPIGSRKFVVGINVLPSATLGLAGAFRRNGSQADVDLGELTEGIVPLPLALRVQSTRGYRIGFESMNSGKLRLGGTDWTVPYQLQVDGRTIALGGDASLAMGHNAGLRNDTLPLVFRVGNVDDHRAGLYSDVLTVSIAAE